MVVVFEFIGNEPLDNVITSMNYKVNKVVYFGYHETIENRKKSTKRFLKKYCGVEIVSFRELRRNDLQSILNTMQQEIDSEIRNKNDVYFDVSGGESLSLVAFGMLSTKYNVPMHMFDVVENKVIELDEGASRSISRDVKPREVKLNLDMFIELKGGVINHSMHKDSKGNTDENPIENLKGVWEVAKRHGGAWNSFSNFICEHMDVNAKLHASAASGRIRNNINKPNVSLSLGEFERILMELSSVGAIRNCRITGSRYEFDYSSKQLLSLIREAGSLLELYIYQQERTVSDDCRVGVHLDWDGVINNGPTEDVLNEIDVMSLRGNVPVFISCKAGKMTSKTSLHALYELKSVTERFGGKYAKMVLATSQAIPDAYRLRAAEMNIELW